MTPIQLIDLIKTLPNSEDHIFEEDNKHSITTEWLCGTFAGRSFKADKLEDAAQQMIDYFNSHIGHDSIVGKIVTESGFPDLEKVKKYLNQKLIERMKIQKFKRGNLVHIAKDLGGSMSHFTSDVDAIIIGSYADQFGGDDVTSYTVMFQNGGTSSWYNEWQLTFIDEGGEHLIKQARQKFEEQKQVDVSSEYIKANLEESNLSTTSILHLFNLLNFKSRFPITGEYFHLYMEWQKLHPIFMFIKNAKSLDEIKNPNEIWDIESVYNFLH